jgi:uncharacterized membrane protein
MLLWLLGIIFFAITFGPRFYTLMNFNFGFFDLGLYTQFLSDMSLGFLNPYIPTLDSTFFAQRPQPLMVVLWPVSFFTTHPTVFLFLDEVSIVVAAAVCANFSWRKTHEASIAIAQGGSGRNSSSALFGFALYRIFLKTTAPLDVSLVHPALPS